MRLLWIRPRGMAGECEVTGSIPGRWGGQNQSPQAPEDGEVAPPPICLLFPRVLELTVVFWAEPRLEPRAIMTRSASGKKLINESASSLSVPKWVPARPCLQATCRQSGHVEGSGSQESRFLCP